jgi:hypothetical protein
MTIGYTSITIDGKSAFIVGKILEIGRNGNEITGKVALSEDSLTIIRVIFVSDVTKDTFYLQEQKTSGYSLPVVL